MTPSERKAWRENNEQMIRDYLASGKTIETIPAGWEKAKPEPEEWVDSDTAALILGLTTPTLRDWMREFERGKRKDCPEFRREGRNRVRWNRASLSEWKSRVAA